jgi:hypothetical protein
MAPSENRNSSLPPSPQSASGSGDFQEQLASLRRVFLALLISTLLLGSALGLFLLRQAAITNYQITEANLVMATLRTNVVPPMDLFVRSLQAFARTNSDFSPIVAKYRLLPATSAVPAAVAAPKASAPKTQATKK